MLLLFRIEMILPLLLVLLLLLLRRTPHPVIVTIRDKKDYIRVLLYSIIHYYRVGGPPKLLRLLPRNLLMPADDDGNQSPRSEASNLGAQKFGFRV